MVVTAEHVMHARTTGRVCTGCGKPSSVRRGMVTAFLNHYWHRQCFKESRTMNPFREFTIDQLCTLRGALKEQLGALHRCAPSQDIPTWKREEENCTTMLCSLERELFGRRKGYREEPKP